MVFFLVAIAVTRRSSGRSSTCAVDLGVDRAAQAAGVLPALQRFLFGALVAPQTRHQVVEVHLVAVEVGPVDAGELDLVADLDAAAAAHAGAVDHHRVQADDGLDLVCARRFGAALHHDRRADGDHLVDVGVFGDRLLDAFGDEALDARRAVVGADDQLVADGAELALPEHQVAGCGSRRRRSRRRRCACSSAPAGTPARRRARRRRRPPSSPARCGSGCPSVRPSRTDSCRRGSWPASPWSSCRPPG